MLRLISFQENGERLEHLGQQAAFFGVEYNGAVVEYSTSVEAAKDAMKRLQTLEVELTGTIEVGLKRVQ